MITDKELDNVETKKLLPIFQDFLENIATNVDAYQTIEEFEYKSRSGFHAFNHNRGGLDLIAITDNASLIGSGYHIGTSIEKLVNNSWRNTYNEVLKENPHLSEDELYDRVYENESDEYSGQAFRVRVMYEGSNIVKIYAGWDLDAPYFRWSNRPEFEKEIKFRTKREFKSKLKKLIDKIEKLA